MVTEGPGLFVCDHHLMDLVELLHTLVFLDFFPHLLRVEAGRSHCMEAHPMVRPHTTGPRDCDFWVGLFQFLVEALLNIEVGKLVGEGTNLTHLEVDDKQDHSYSVDPLKAHVARRLRVAVAQEDIAKDVKISAVEIDDHALTVRWTLVGSW